MAKCPDETDLKILALLQENSRMPFQEIGKKLGVSDATVYNRVQKMLKENIIKRFTVDIREKKFGFNVVVSMGFNVDTQNFDSILEQLKSSDYLYEVWTTTGAHNITARAIFKDMDGIAEFTKWINSIKGISKFDFTIVVNESKTTPRINLKKKNEEN